MAWIGAAIAAGGSILGDVMSQQGQQQTNQLNQQEILQEEGWESQMSDTAMQRRVTDLKAAGINPMLAVGQGGASTPGIGTLPAQNPNQAFGNLGQQVTSALGLQIQQAQVQALTAKANADQAQADNTNAQTQSQLPAQVDYIKSMTGLNDANAKVAASNVQFIGQQVLQSQSQTALNVANTRVAGDQASLTAAQTGTAMATTANVEAQTRLTQANTDVAEVQALLQGQNYQVLLATKNALISAANSDSQAKALAIPGMANLSDVQQSRFGKVLAYINAALNPISTGAGVAAKFAK